MGKYLRKCKGVGEVTATEAVGIRTRARALALTAAVSSMTRSTNKAVARRSSKRRKAASAERGASYLELRSRSVFLRPPAASSAATSGEISRCSSRTSLETPPPSPMSGQRIAEELGTTACSYANREEKKETRDEVIDLAADAMTTVPSEAEIEEFFAAAERDERRRFANKYNYDVIADVPLVAGRYEWVPVD